MSASEALKALSAWREMTYAQSQINEKIADALPELIALVEAAEHLRDPAYGMPVRDDDVVAALAALAEKLEGLDEFKQGTTDFVGADQDGSPERPSMPVGAAPLKALVNKYRHPYLDIGRNKDDY